MAVLPSLDAGPSKVRAYLHDLLIQEHEAPPELAQSSVNKWELGRGSDLRRKCLGDFKQLFGESVGPYLYESVQRDVVAERRSSPTWKRTYWTMVTVSVAAIFFLIQALCSRSQAQTVDNLGYAMVVFGPTMFFCAFGAPNDDIFIGALFGGVIVSCGALIWCFSKLM